MPTSRSLAIKAQSRDAFPSAVRQAVHDISQPLQALRMMVGLPGVVTDDQRHLPDKVDYAVSEIDRQLTQLHTLARVLDADHLGQAETLRFSETLSYAQQVSPDLWQQGQSIRIYGKHRQIKLPSRNGAWVLNALLEMAIATYQADRIVIGVRPAMRELVFGFNGVGLSRQDAVVLERTLNGGEDTPLSCGLMLAKLLVSGWGGQWSINSSDMPCTLIRISM